METKTIKLGPDEYTNFDNEFKDHDVIILTGARGAGKSYPVAKFVSDMIGKESKFVYMRTNDRELSTFAGWCQDLNLDSLSEFSHTYNLKRGKPHRGNIMLEGINEDGLVTFERIIGQCMSLESSHIYKSGRYDEFVCMVYEEYAHLNMNPKVEERAVFNFLENVETIFRKREKKIFLMANNLKTLPLIERTIVEETGTTFKNPIKIKIFRKAVEGKKISRFRQYMNGELYEDDSFIPRINDFVLLYTNKKYIVRIHKVYPRKFYVQTNLERKKKIYTELDYLSLKIFCQQSSNNEFYFQNKSVEAIFTSEYNQFVNEIAFFISEKGHRFLI